MEKKPSKHQLFEKKREPAIDKRQKENCVSSMIKCQINTSQILTFDIRMARHGNKEDWFLVLDDYSDDFATIGGNEEGDERKEQTDK